MEKIKIEFTTTPKAKTSMDGVAFGTVFSDHMFLMNYDNGAWHDPRIVPYADIPLPPSAMVFHYGQEIFEGLKAYRGDDGRVRLCRPIENVRRMNTSADRLCMPQIPEDMYIEALKTLVEIEKDWVPGEPDTSLYLRPFYIATDPHLGVHASHSYIFCIICSPVGSYYPEGLSPVRILIENNDVRAVRGGTGYAKCGGNYAASLRAGKRAEENGYSQVLWLDGITRRNIEEVGAMNVMFKIEGKIITPALTGSVLPGITRKSCLELLGSWGYEVQERDFTIDELIEAAESGKLEEAWGTGTAAVISPIGEVSFEGVSHKLGNMKIGELTLRLYDTLTGIQWGKIEDEHNWSIVVC